MLIREQAPEAVSRILEITGQGFTALQLFEKAAKFKGLLWNQTKLPIRAIEVGKIRCLTLQLPPQDIALEIISDQMASLKFADIGETEEEWWFQHLPGPMEEDSIEFKFLVDLNINEDEKGIEFRSIIQTDQNWPGPTAFHEQLLRILYLAPALTERIKAIPIMAEMAEVENTLTITWEQLGLVGLVSTAELFEQFRGQNALLWRLTQSEFNPFNPKPLSNGGHANFWFLQKEALEIFQIWRWQLNNHIHSLGL